jgi:glycosyltransferase involved in cell wall biosynthesis
LPKTVINGKAATTIRGQTTSQTRSCNGVETTCRLLQRGWDCLDSRQKKTKGRKFPAPASQFCQTACEKAFFLISFELSFSAGEGRDCSGMERIEKTVFLSYRRTNIPWALAIFQNLEQHGYDVFFDYNGIGSGDFERVIVENIAARAHFLVLLTPTALERCDDPADLLRREIETALVSKRNIVPLMLEGFNFGTPKIASQLTGTLAALKHYNGLNIPPDYFDEAMERLRSSFLNVPLAAVLHPVSLPAQRAAAEQKAAANGMIDNSPQVPPDWKPMQQRERSGEEQRREAAAVAYGYQTPRRNLQMQIFEAYVAACKEKSYDPAKPLERAVVGRNSKGEISITWVKLEKNGSTET